MSNAPIKFPNETGKEFVSTLRNRVNDYFKEKGITRFGDASMVLKTVFMLSLYFVPYAFMLSGTVSSTWGFLGLWVLMGLGMAGIGFSVMHDANHNAYSSNRTLNKVIGYTLNMLGGNATNWKIQHNKLHHSFTNIDGMDDDITRISIMRFSPHSKLRFFHRFQHIYAWFFYGFLTLSWVTSKEFLQLADYRRRDLTKEHGEFGMLMLQMTLTKIAYYGYIMVLPLVLLDVSPWLIIAGFFSLHFVAGFTLSVVFQLAHVMPECEFPTPDEAGTMENNWAIHQLLTTSNYSHENRVLSWFVGGLNYQVEHHLFPSICHIHYRKLSEIVRKTAQEFKLPYNSNPTFFGALYSHAKMLHTLGTQEHLPEHIHLH